MAPTPHRRGGFFSCIYHLRLLHPPSLLSRLCARSVCARTTSPGGRPLVCALRVCAYYLSWRPAACVRVHVCACYLSWRASFVLLSRAAPGHPRCPAPEFFLRTPAGVRSVPASSPGCEWCGSGPRGGPTEWRLLVMRSLSGWSAQRPRPRTCHIGRSVVSPPVRPHGGPAPRPLSGAAIPLGNLRLPPSGG